jgi:hypothetical protein
MDKNKDRRDMKKNTVIIDDLPFIPYMDNGLQCLVFTDEGKISIRRDGFSLFTDKEHPYEVWYPTEAEPSGYQTADDIWNYIKQHSKAYKDGHSNTH